MRAQSTCTSFSNAIHILFLLISQVLSGLKIPFNLLTGLAKDRLPQLVKEHSISAVVCDFSPLRVPVGWVKDTGTELDNLGVPLIQVGRRSLT